MDEECKERVARRCRHEGIGHRLRPWRDAGSIRAAQIGMDEPEDRLSPRQRQLFERAQRHGVEIHVDATVLEEVEIAHRIDALDGLVVRVEERDEVGEGSLDEQAVVSVCPEPHAPAGGEDGGGVGSPRLRDGGKLAASPRLVEQ